MVAAARQTKLGKVETRIRELSRMLNAEPFEEFIRKRSPQLPPPRHLKPIIEVIERARHKRVRACIELPPRHAKTTTILHAIPWWLDSSPADTCAYASYNDDIARSKSRIARRLAIESGIELSMDSRDLSEWRTKNGGGLLAGGAGGGLTGQGVSGLMVVDDSIKNRVEADSAVRRNVIWEWFNEVVMTRLEGASVLNIGTPWHPDDLFGRLAKTGEWEMIRLPAIAEENDILGRKEGEALWPERYPIEELEKIRKQIGEWSFSALYQCRPRPRGHGVFQGAHYYDPTKVDLTGAKVVIIADPAASTKKTADHSCAIAIAFVGHGEKMRGYVLGLIRMQKTVPQFVSALIDFRKQIGWGAPVGVEAVAGFKAVPQLLKDLAPNLPVFEVPTLGDKFQRSQPAAAAWNDGRILLPINAPWIDPFLAEVQIFTGVKDAADDQVDVLSHCWNTVALIEYVKRGAVADVGRWR